MGVFKKWGYAAGGQSQVFEVSETSPDLPPGWHESPADIPGGAAPPPPPLPPPEPPREDEEPASRLAGTGLSDILRRAAEEAEESELDPDEQRDILRQEAESLGIKVDRRWSVQTLEKMIEAARGNDT